MDANYLEEVLKSLSEKQQKIKETLSEALLKATNNDEKEKIIKLLDYNNQIEVAIAKKDIELLQKIYNDASSNQ